MNSATKADGGYAVETEFLRGRSRLPAKRSVVREVIIYGFSLNWS